MSRWTPLLLLGVTALVLASSVGAATRSVSTTQAADLSTNEGVAAYLSSKGMSAKGFVVQRGQLNYSGPKCPGRGWTCTKKTKVVQISSGRHGKNRSECGPGGTLTDTTTAGTRTITCIVVQTAASGKNHARCALDARGVSPVVLDCRIEQTNVNGDNKARVSQRVVQRDGASQLATLSALVTQRNGSGDNRSDVDQTIDQTTHDVQLATSPAQNQEGRFSARIAQSSETGSNDSHLSQDLDQRGRASGSSSIVQRQFGNHFGDVDQTIGEGSEGLALSNHKPKSKSKSKSFSRSRAHQSERQRLKGPGQQIQIGPLFCCSTQLGGDQDKTRVRIRQDSKQTASQANAQQSQSITGECTTVGKCGIRQLARNDEDSIRVRERCTAPEGGTCSLFVPTSCNSESGCSTGDEEGSTSKKGRRR
jgi:hypothetical protein